ncbi:MAG: DUF4157 domain-containing protein [Alphaproteobacteria bacterium]|nr:DUF4157 domain-containing protein [Alphaproteobacteria bacterium]MBU0799304.1 DUF4157 domain-containing protein [Alphaproteobacteria bacterium]MBU0885740.1 DUF4157 domain-containing protein [Alphaproteobacteria bacterium]MBU1814443.1 DUF4157 domain-containing protein [Alphaproteobacteria bacterium]
MRSGVIQGNFPFGRSPGGDVAQRHGSGGAAFQVPAAMAARLGSSAGGYSLPPAIQRRMEGVLGASLGDVRIRVGPEAAALGAVAFTMGSTIHFAPGRYDPNSRQGLQLLGHELAHVVQQRQGRVRNPFGSGIAVVSDRTLEAQADAMGMKAAMAVGMGEAGPVQRQVAGYPQSVAQPRWSWGALAGIAGAGLAGLTGFGAIGIGVAGVTSLLAGHYLSGDTPGARLDVPIAFSTNRPARLRKIPPQYSITLNAYKHGRLDVGHAFVTIEMDGKVTMAMGLSPRDLPDDTLRGRIGYFLNTVKGQAGRIYVEFDSLGDGNLKRKTWPITEDQAARAMTKMNEDRRLNLDTAKDDEGDHGWGGGPSYNTFSNCASWALDVLAAAGVNTWSYRSLVTRPGAFYNAI